MCIANSSVKIIGECHSDNLERTFEGKSEYSETEEVPSSFTLYYTKTSREAVNTYKKIQLISRVKKRPLKMWSWHWEMCEFSLTQKVSKEKH